MEIVVCIKQVPSDNNLPINPETNRIEREGKEGIINPCDLFALEEALRIKERAGGRVTALSLGIPAARKILSYANMMGVDRAVLLSDPVFGGSDSLVTAYALCKGIEKLGPFDLILCGKQAIDGDTGQVGPGLAEKLHIPHLTNVQKISHSDGSTLLCERHVDDTIEVSRVELPALLTVIKDINEPRIPSLRNRMKGKSKEVTVLGKDDLELIEEKCGQEGSPTRVIKIFTPQYNRHNEVLQGTPDEQASQLLHKISDSLANINP